MNNYYLPYENVSDLAEQLFFVRRILGGNKNFLFHPGIWKDPYGKWRHHYKTNSFLTKKAAMEDLDKILLDYGAIFIDQKLADQILIFI